jgi:Rrf2 family protein
MKINTKIRYGLRTMTEIALSDQEEGVLQKEISEKQNISFKYLDTIIAALKTKGLIINAKGKGSGYKLAKPAHEITIYDIYTAFDSINIVDCIQNINYCDRHCNCIGRSYWTELRNDFIQLLKKNTLADIIVKYGPKT